MMPSIEELEEMSQLMYGNGWFYGINHSDKHNVVNAVIAARKNDILCDIVTTLDRIQNDTDTIAKVAWDKS